MSMKSVALATMGATAGFVAGNYLYNLDKEANKYKEVPVPFYTVRKVADDISKETKKMVDEIKAKCCKNAEEVIDEDVVEEVEQQIHEVTDEEVAEELKSSEQPIIDATVVDGKAVEVDGEGNPVSMQTIKEDQQNVAESSQTIVGNTEETSIPQFTVVDQVPVNKEDKQEESKAEEQKAPTTTKATTKGSKAKAGK